MENGKNKKNIKIKKIRSGTFFICTAITHFLNRQNVMKYAFNEIKLNRIDIVHIHIISPII